MALYDWLTPGTKVRLKKEWAHYKADAEAYIESGPDSGGIVVIVPSPGSDELTFIHAALLKRA